MMITGWTGGWSRSVTSWTLETIRVDGLLPGGRAKSRSPEQSRRRNSDVAVDSEPGSVSRRARRPRLFKSSARGIGSLRAEGVNRPGDSRGRDPGHHIFGSTRELIRLLAQHQILLSFVVPSMRMVAAARFNYSAAALVQLEWTDVDLD
jgi:hypothetical protein